jgi:adenosylcobinamide kinase / adenosylcobinamide-phosphate guanylyltransferase
VDEESFRKAIQSEIEELLNAIRTTEQHWIIISNEVGLGLVPPYPMGRVYRDELGWANQRLAQDADEVLFMVAGLPMKVK